MPGQQVGPGGGAAPIDEPPAPPPYAPSPAPPTPGRQYAPSAPKYGAAKTSAAPSAPVDHTWDGVPSGYKTELEDLALQWQQVAGFGVTIDEATLRKMADAHVVSLRDLGMWMWRSGPMTDDLKNRSPWLAFGMDQSTFNRQLSDYQDTYEQLTGQRPGWNQANPDAVTYQMSDAFQRNLTQSGLREELMHDENIRSTYGWIKFGLNFDDFQNRKTDMRLSFGQELTNDQAVLQLQYLHQAQGSGRAVAAQAPPAQQQGPATPSEVTVR